jgi:acyl carrier protein
MSLRSRVREVLQKTPLTIHENIVLILVRSFHCDPKDITPKATLTGTLGFNAMDLEDFRVILEDEFEIAPDFAEHGDTFTVGELVEWLAAP